MKYSIQLNTIQLKASHGVYESEKKSKNNFEIDISLQANITNALLSDDIKDTIDYVKVYNTIQEQMHVPVNLLEHLAYKIIHSLFQLDHRIDIIKIHISKLNPPIGGDCLSSSVCIEIERKCFVSLFP
ncbi:MAG: dihydroneopterin aldolase [Chitinophagaceae bacterium]|nr:dihydroneopterin aldolase [Chitinophagaceae bacterium]